MSAIPTSRSFSERSSSPDSCVSDAEKERLASCIAMVSLRFNAYAYQWEVEMAYYETNRHFRGCDALLSWCEQSINPETACYVAMNLAKQGLCLHRREMPGSRLLFVLCTDQNDHSLVEHTKDVPLICHMIERFLKALDPRKEKQLNELCSAHSILAELCTVEIESHTHVGRVCELQSLLSNRKGSNRWALFKGLAFPAESRAEAQFVDDGVFLLDGQLYLQGMSMSEEEYQVFKKQVLPTPF